MTKLWYALQRESSLAAEHLASGVTALGKANYAQEYYLAQAFFALTIGLERCAKTRTPDRPCASARWQLSR